MLQTSIARGFLLLRGARVVRAIPTVRAVVPEPVVGTVPDLGR